MSLDLTAIEQRVAKAAELADGHPLRTLHRASTDVDDLLAEVKRLTKAVESQTAVANAALAGSARRQAELDRVRAGINDTVAALRAAAMAEDGQPAYGFAAGLNDGLQLATARLRALLDGPR